MDESASPSLSNETARVVRAIASLGRAGVAGKAPHGDAPFEARPLDDDVVRLRIWGSDRSFAFALDEEMVVGTAVGCSIRLDDPRERAAPRHARLRCTDAGQWALHDLGSESGVFIDGVRRTDFPLSPGAEVQLGGVTLVAESERWVVLRAFVQRLLGWSADRLEAVDLALRALRLWAARRAPLILRGDGKMAPIARAIHRLASGHDEPFVLCNPRQKKSVAGGRFAIPNYPKARSALEAASGGTLCFLGRRIPADFAAVAEELRKPSAQARVVICESLPDGRTRMPAVSIAAIDVPPLSRRASELSRIIDAYSADAAAALPAMMSLNARERALIGDCCLESLSAIETTTLRLLALAQAGNVYGASKLLGMSHPALARWVAARRSSARNT